MHEPFLVGMMEAQGRLAEIFHCLADRDVALVLDLCMEIDSVDVLHHDKVDLSHLIEVKGPGHVLMAQAESHLSLPTEPGQKRALLHSLDRQHLDGHPLMECGVFRKVHAAHASGPEQLEQPIFAQHESPVAALAELAHLPVGEQASRYQALRQFLGQRGRGVGPGSGGRRQTVFINQSAPADDRQELGDCVGGMRHGMITGEP